jgi:diguanylate cyclase (GGDEF)-like protein
MIGSQKALRFAWAEIIRNPSQCSCCALIWALLLCLSPLGGTSEHLRAGTAAHERHPASALPLILDRPDGLPRSLFPFLSYGTDSGLGNLAVRRMAQDTIGFLWVGTEDGLYRFDGDRFTRFDSSNGLPSTWITDLISTPEGRLWVCTPGGLAMQNGNRFQAMPTESSGMPDGPCNAVARDSQGVIWVAHKTGLFFRSNNRFHQVMGFPAGPASALVSVPGPTSSVYAAGKGFVVHVRGYHIDAKYAVAPTSMELIDSLAADRSGTIWAQSARKLFALQPGSEEFHNESERCPAISSRGVLTVDRDGRLWVPTDEGMSCRIGDQWRNFGVRDGLPTDWTRFIFQDREGSLWIGSLGIHRLVGRGAWTSWTRTQGLPSETIWDIYRSKRGDLWVATDKGLCRATPNGWYVLPGTEKTVVRHIHEDARGRIWMGLMPAGILCCDPITNQVSRYGRPSGVAGLRVLSLEEDETGQLWAATDGAGLLRYRLGKNDFIREEVPDGSPEETFRFILRDKENRLWVTGEHGLLLRSGGKWLRLNRKDGFLQDHVSYITEMNPGEFWVSYFEPLGIFRFIMNGEKPKILEHMDEHSGLASAKVYLLGKDLKGNLWVGTGKGVDVVSPEGILHFWRGNGVAGDDIDAMAFLAEPNGSVFIGTSSGLSMYRSDAEPEKTAPLQPVLLSASVGDHPLPLGGSAAPSFSSRDNTLKVEFAVLSFLHQSQIEYGVRLKGLESEWHSSRFREARYPGLSPGTYVYEVRSRIGSGPWSPITSIAFEIQNPWWQTWPAIAAGLILISSVVFGGFRWRLKHLRNRTRHLESLVSARTIELALANADLERLSITDPLTGLKNRRFLEFSIGEDLARVRRNFQSPDGEWQGFREDCASITFVLVDIDHFKTVNDRFGHTFGDKVLRQMGSVLSSAVRESDTIVRWGGEEFLIIARNSKPGDAAILSERLRQRVEAAPFGVTNDQRIRLTCSIGFASWPFFKHDLDALGWQEVLGLADRCLYLAKNSGRNAWLGLATRADYRGRADYTILNDLVSAESAGILEIQSSASAGLVFESLNSGAELKGSEILFPGFPGFHG